MRAFAFLKCVAVAFAGVVSHELQILLQELIETWKDYVNPAGAAATGATWTTRCQIRHPLTIITTWIEWATMYQHALGCGVAIDSWRPLHGPGPPGQATLPMVTST